MDWQLQQAEIEGYLAIQIWFSRGIWERRLLASLHNRNHLQVSCSVSAHIANVL